MPKGVVYLVGGFFLYYEVFAADSRVNGQWRFFLHWVAPNGSTGRAAKSNRTATY
jgi:hypothetical protein